MGISLSPLCNRNEKNLPKSQCDFIDFIVRPCVSIFSSYCQVRGYRPIGLVLCLACLHLGSHAHRSPQILYLLGSLRAAAWLSSLSPPQPARWSNRNPGTRGVTGHPCTLYSRPGTCVSVLAKARSGQVNRSSAQDSTRYFLFGALIVAEPDPDRAS